MNRYFCFIYEDESFYEDYNVRDLVTYFVDYENIGNAYEAYLLGVF